MGAIRFSAPNFKRLSIDKRLAYLRAAFGALRNGARVLDAPLAGRVNIATISKASFERLPLREKVQYLNSVSRKLRERRRMLERVGGYFKSSAATALPISSVPTVLAPGAARSAVRKPRANTERTARRMRSSPSTSSKE